MCFFFNFQFYGFHQLSDLQTCNHPFLPVSPCQPRDSLGLFSQDLQSLTAWPCSPRIISWVSHSLPSFIPSTFDFDIISNLQKSCKMSAPKIPVPFTHFHNILLHFIHHSTYDGFETLEIIVSIVHFSGCFFKSRTFFSVNTASSNLRNLSLI